MGAATKQTLTSVCDLCREPISITVGPGQRWDEVDWQHDDQPEPRTHRPVPELRYAIDATCPGCKYPEIGFAPARDEFVCSRCGHTQTQRPKD